jgi:hypothetical protein
MQDINNLKGRTKDLNPESHISIDDEIFIWILPLDEHISYARIFSSPDKEIGICIKDTSYSPLLHISS